MFVGKAVRCGGLQPLCERYGLLVAFRDLRIGNGPLDPDIRVIEPDRNVRLPVVGSRRFVLHLGPIRQHAKTASETCWGPHPFLVLRGKFRTPPLATGWRTFP